MATGMTLWFSIFLDLPDHRTGWEQIRQLNAEAEELKTAQFRSRFFGGWSATWACTFTNGSYNTRGHSIHKRRIPCEKLGTARYDSW